MVHYPASLRHISFSRIAGIIFYQCGMAVSKSEICNLKSQIQTYLCRYEYWL